MSHGYLIDDFMPPPTTNNPQDVTAAPPPTTTTTSPLTTTQPVLNNPRPPINPEQRVSPPSLHIRSCVTCRRRKVKCDKQDPCQHCVRAGIPCVYPAPGRAPRKPRQQSAKPVSERENELLKRLRRLEGVVEELSGQVELGSVRQSPTSPRMETPTSVDPPSSNTSQNVRVIGMDEGTRRDWLVKQSRIGIGPPKTAFTVENATQGIGSLVLGEGKSKYVASPFWASITDEVAEINQMLEEHDWESDSDTPPLPSDVVTEPNHQAFITGYSSVDVNLKAIHPVSEQIPIYWKTFLDNVHPMTMLIHAPTVGKVMKEVESKIDNLSPSTEALLFSIYFATITSMSSEEVLKAFRIGKEELIRQHRFGCEQALARAGFLNTNEIVTVQAFVLFLICVRRHDDTRFVWSMTGLALRIAQGLGLHRDGTRFKLSPFDTEMRRRLWYHVLVLDVRASEDHGSDTTIIEYDTEYPLNINDEDISPGDEKSPMAREGTTEMTFSLIRCEIISLIRKLMASSISSPNYQGLKELSIEEKEALVKETSLRLEDKYLRYCNNAGPLFWVAASVARLILVKMNLLIYLPLTQPGNQHNLKPSLRDKLFISSLEVIEYARMLETEISTKQWNWIQNTYVQWHAIAFILGELADRDDTPTVQRAWAAIHAVFDPWGGTTVVMQKDGMLWQPLRKLMAMAKRRKVQNAAKSLEATIPTGDATVADSRTPITTQNPAHSADYGQTAQGSGISSMFYGAAVVPTPQVTSISVPPTVNGTIAGHRIQHPDGSVSNPINVPINNQVNGYSVDPVSQAAQFNQMATADDAFLDVDMSSLDNIDMNWSGWDDMVRDFQLEADNVPRDNSGRGPTMAGLGNWW